MTHPFPLLNVTTYSFQKQDDVECQITLFVFYGWIHLLVYTLSRDFLCVSDYVLLPVDKSCLTSIVLTFIRIGDSSDNILLTSPTPSNPFISELYTYPVYLPS